jgi:ATP-dependent RNA helicase DDX60
MGTDYFACTMSNHVCPNTHQSSDHSFIIVFLFSGLSATIGSAETFNKWLESVQHAHGYEHAFISHPHRYSHLRKFYYALRPTPDSPFPGLDVYTPPGNIRFLHPIAMLSSGALTLPADLALEASDTLRLYEALAMHKDKISVNLDNLKPERFFQNVSLLRQEDIIRYEVALKEVIVQMTSLHDTQGLASPLHSVVHHLEDPILSATPRRALEAQPSKPIFRGNLLYLLSELHCHGDLVCAKHLIP